MFEVQGKYTKAVIMIDDIEKECLSQIISMVNNIAFTNPIVIMPDTHSGKGSVIGFTMKLGDKIIPNIVGVDIGCSMLSFNIGDIQISVEMLDDAIRKLIPFGMNIRETPHKLSMNVDTDEYRKLYTRVGIDRNYALNSIGTLGGGNHFIEVGLDQYGDKWVTIHTGSRKLGKNVCEYWQKVAVDYSLNKGESLNDGINRIKNTFPKNEWNKEIVNLRNNIKMKNTRATGLEYLEGENMKGYLEDMKLAQHYAKVNRTAIFYDILTIFNNCIVKSVIETTHNYISFEDGIIRKGAIRAYKGEKCIIPWNQRDGLIIAEGKSNPDWNFSAPHGAGRVLSRSKAKATLSVEKYRNDMKGIYSTSVCYGTIDEAPDVYKDYTVIREAIKPTVSVLYTVKPIHNMKSIEGEDE